MRLFILFLTCATVASAAPAARMEEAQPRRGQALARITWFDQTGAKHSLGELAGYPLILLPMYSQCRASCPANIRSLIRALSEAKVDAKDYRVLLFSIDPGETSNSLAQMRRIEAVPLGWLSGRANAAGVDALTNSIGFEFGRNGDQFMHP